MLCPKENLVRDKAYLKHVRGLPCVVTGRMGDDIDPAHIRYGLGGGMGMKPGDDVVLPLSHNEHERQHRFGGEVDFWLSSIGKNPDLLMRALKAYAREIYREYQEGK